MLPACYAYISRSAHEGKRGVFFPAPRAACLGESVSNGVAAAAVTEQKPLSPIGLAWIFVLGCCRIKPESVLYTQKKEKGALGSTVGVVVGAPELLRSSRERRGGWKRGE